jgi:hypothetical protein
MRSRQAIPIALFAALLVSGCSTNNPTDPDLGYSPAVHVWLSLVVPDYGDVGLRPGANPDLDFYLGIRGRLLAQVAGRGPGGDCRVVFSVDGQVLAESTVTVPRGSGFYMKVEGPEWKPESPGDHRLSVRVNPAPQVGDQDSTDNVFESVVTVHPTGNLTAASVVVMDMGYPHNTYYSTVVLGSTHWVWFRVLRSGFCGGYQVRVACGSDTILNVRDNCSVALGSQELYYFGPWTFNRIGSFELRAVIDANDEWAEESEADNIATNTITVAAQGPTGTRTAAGGQAVPFK